MENRNLIILIVVFVLIIALAVVGYNYLVENYVPEELPPETEQTDALQAPDFEFMKSDGSFIKLSDFKGKKIVLNFWASWCGPCKSEMPAFEKMYKKYKNEVEFIMVNLTDGGSETVSTAQEFISTSGYTFPVYFDTKLEGATNYSVYSIPYTVIIDSEGNIFASHPGAMSENVLEGYIQNLTN